MKSLTISFINSTINALSPNYKFIKCYSKVKLTITITDQNKIKCVSCFLQLELKNLFR